MKISRAYKAELKPNNKQIGLFNRSIGCARFVFNWAVRRRRNAYEWCKTFAAYAADDIAEYDELRKRFARSAVPNRVVQSRELTQLKKEKLWLKFPDAMTLVGVIRDDVDSAFKNFFRGCAKGEGIGYPRFRKKGCHESFVVNYQQTKVEKDRIKLGKLGWVRLKRWGYLPQDVHINSVTISRRANKWYVSIQVDEDIKVTTPLGKRLGIDMGMACDSFMTVTEDDGKTYRIKNSLPLKKYSIKLKRLQRGLSRKKKGSKNWIKWKDRISRTHRKIWDIRSNHIHNATSRITYDSSVIAIEDLNVKQMLEMGKGEFGVHGRRRQLSDSGIGEALRQIDYKTKWKGIKLIKVDQKENPSTQTCCKCGNRKRGSDKLGLEDRIYHCNMCGNVMDRDENSSHYLMTFAVVQTGSKTPVEECSEGIPEKQEVGPGRPGKTDTQLLGMPKQKIEKPLTGRYINEEVSEAVIAA